MRVLRGTRAEIDEPLLGTVFDDLAELDAYRDDLRESGLFERMGDAARWFAENVSAPTERGHRPVLGALPRGPDARLYALVRKLRPERAVETGVCNGTSTAVLLQALHDSGRGRLVSIDWPEYTDTPEGDRDFWDGKGGAVVPASKEPGWVVPEHVRDRWELVIGRSQDELEPLLERLGSIDLFFHDSEHSVECMTFEYRASWKRLRAGGVLASDDVNWNEAFDDFAASVGRPIHRLGAGLALIRK